MPAKNSKKAYVENGYYHIYNRGVEKRNIFGDAKDYSVFLRYLKEYLEPKKEEELYGRLSQPTIGWKEKEEVLRLLRLNNFFGRIDLLTYALMPNHLHFLLKQAAPQNIDSFCNSLITRYVMYFNKKYARVGPLFQGVYKAVLVESESQLLHLSRYIHRNPLSLGTNSKEHQNLYTSLPEYLNHRKTVWLKPEEILGYFSKSNPRNSYEAFVEEKEDLDLLQNLTIEKFA